MVNRFRFKPLFLFRLNLSPLLQQIHPMSVIFPLLVPLVPHVKSIAQLIVILTTVNAFLELFFHFSQESLELYFLLNRVYPLVLDLLNVFGSCEVVGKAKIEPLFLN